MKNKIIWIVLTVILAPGILFFVSRMKERLMVNRGEWVEAAVPSLNCEAFEKEKPYPNSYQGVLIDAHMHVPSIPDGPFREFDDSDEMERLVMGANVSMADYVCLMESENIKKAFAFFPVWEPIVDESVLIVRKTMDKYGQYFVPFIMPPYHDDRADGFPTVTARELEKMLEIYPGLFQGYGEIGLYERGDNGGPKGSLALPPDSLRLKEIYPVVRENNLLIYFHLGRGQQEAFERTLSENPDINFIWHGDQLIPYEEGGKQNLKHIDEILSRHPNAYYEVDELYGDVFILRPEVSKKDFLAHFKNYEPLLEKDLETWKSFIEKHPDQVIWGTDRGAGASWSLDLEVGEALTRYTRAFIGRLDPSVQENYAYKNAERLLQNLTETEFETSTYEKSPLTVEPEPTEKTAKPEAKSVVQASKTQVPPQTNNQTNVDEPPLLLKSIGVNLDYYESVSNRAGDFLFTKEPLSFGRLFMGFGFVIPGGMSSSGQSKSNPQPTYILPLGTPVRSLVDGIVVSMPILWSNDYSIQVTANGKLEKWIYETEHILNPKVKVGDKVKAGQIIGEVSNFDQGAPAGFGATEIGILKGGSAGPQHVCPFAYLDPSIKEETEKKIVSLFKSWENYIGDSALYDESLSIPPGCLTQDPIDG